MNDYAEPGGAVIDGAKIPKNLHGCLTETDFSLATHETLAKALEQDGYIFGRGLIDEGEVEAARNEVFQRLGEVDELEKPFENGIFS